MNVINSHSAQHDDDSDITIINPSINEDSLTNSQVPQPGAANNFNHYSSSDPSDYIFVHHDPLENAKKIEEVLVNYVRDLKKESNTQLDCDKGLVVRLLDLIRPAYSTNQQKLTALDRIRDDIGVLHDQRFVQEKEKLEELRIEVARLNKMLFTVTNDTSNYEDQMKSYSIYNSIPASSLITGYNQWTEIEKDAKKLHEIVQSQRTQINEIVTLISQATSPSSSIEQSPAIPSNQPTNTSGKLPTVRIDQGFLAGIIDKLKNVNKLPSANFPDPTKNEPNDTTIISEHSPGTSPTESMETIVKNTITLSINQRTPTSGNSIEPEPIIQPSTEHKIPTIDPESPTIEQEQPIVAPKPTIIEQNQLTIEEKQPTIEQKPPTVDPKQPTIKPPNISPILINPTPVSPEIPPDALRQCPVCNHSFASECDDVEMYEHIDNCLFPADSFQQPKEYECPSCQRKFPADRENEYLHHMSDCFDNRFEQ